jgi:hypothetical protein
MAAKYFLRHRLPFQHNPITGNLERIGRIGRRGKKLARLERRELEEEKIIIPPIHISFLKDAYMAHSKDAMAFPAQGLVIRSKQGQIQMLM